MNNLIRILAVALMAVVSSCSKALLSDDNVGFDGAYKLIITGKISETNSLKPLEGIRIRFSAYSDKDSESLPIESQTVYTDSKGIYWISASGFTSNISCTLNIEDINNEYKSQTSRLVVDWSGPSFVNDVFYVNDMNLLLKRQ